MKLAKYVVAAMFLSALLDTSAAIAAGPGKNSGNQRGGKAAEHMSTKGAANTNAQWSADPERGWVRAEERHKQHENGGASSNTNQTNGKPKAKGKANKF
ncbi:MAG: hypothetical protein E6J74_04520 [Deltaproteobacteria bacterium]|nr:MAG: hypothetical protein E6J74_04520 [Deltaproteobacteria bacterium]